MEKTTEDFITTTDVLEAERRIKDYIRKTPLEYSHVLSSLCDFNVYLKLESEQITGSFKVRGAVNALLLLMERSPKKDVCAVSAGNHAQGIAMAAKLLGIKAHIIMPKDAAPTKIEATRRYSPEIELYGDSFHDAEEYAKEKARECSWEFISPYNDPAVAAGQGTAMLEVLEQNSDIDGVIIPIGGGGLFSGWAIASQIPKNRHVAFWGVQPRISPHMHNLIFGTDYPIEHSIAGGLDGKIDGASQTIQIVKKYCLGIALVEEDEMKHAIRWLMEYHHKIAEPSGVAGIAALFDQNFRKEICSDYKNQRPKAIAVAITGANIDQNFLDEICMDHFFKKYDIDFSK